MSDESQIIVLKKLRERKNCKMVEKNKQEVL